MKTVYTLVGMKHFNGDDVVRALPGGADLLLVREPTSAHDANAIQVWATSPATMKIVAVGYVGRGRAPGPHYKPGNENAALAKHIDETGAPATSAVPGFSIGAKLVASVPPQIEVTEPGESR